MGWEGPVTSQQLDVWDAWFEEQYNRPSRMDYYLAQIAWVVHRCVSGLFSKSPITTKLSAFILKFTGREERKPGKEQVVFEKEKWAAALGGWGMIRDARTLSPMLLPPEPPQLPLSPQSPQENGKNTTR